MSVAQWRGIGRAFVGIVAVIAGIGSQLVPISGYGAGDWRGDPTMSTIVNGGIALVGVILIVSAAIPFIRDSRSN
jgi:hypothetical protein